MIARFIASALLALAAIAPASAHTPVEQGGHSGTGTIQHIVEIEMENRTVDNLFNGYCNVGATQCANTTLTGTNSSGGTVPLTPQANGIELSYDPIHRHGGFVMQCNTGVLDVTGAPDDGDQITVTINGHAVTTTLAGDQSQGHFASLISAALNADSTDNVIVNTASPSNGSKSRVAVWPLSSANVYTLSASANRAGGGTTGVFSSPQVGGQCPLATKAGFDRYDTNVYVYVPSSYTGPYWQIAQEGAFSDETFEANEGPSTPAHMLMFTGTTRAILGVGATTKEFRENPDVGLAGCEWNGTGVTGDVTASYPFQLDGQDVGSPICLQVPYLAQLLEAKGLTWRYYEPFRNPTSTPGDLWDACAQVATCCGTVIANTCNGPEYMGHVISPETTICNDVAAGALPAVSWVIPTAQNSDHQKSTLNTGPNFVASIVNCIGNSAYWATSAIVITWDDWGGLFDHVPPPLANNAGSSAPWSPFAGAQVNPYQYGFRVPLMVISPYARQNLVDHTVRDGTSVLHFIETQMGLMGPVSTASIELNHDDLGPMFNLGQAPLSFVPIVPNSGL